LGQFMIHFDSQFCAVYYGSRKKVEWRVAIGARKSAWSCVT
jgi:hypothetical protein